LQALDLALDNLDKILCPLGDKEKDREAVDGVISVMCSVFQRVLVHDTAPAAAATLVDKFVSKLTSNTTSQPATRLKTCVLLETHYIFLSDFLQQIEHGLQHSWRQRHCTIQYFFGNGHLCSSGRERASGSCYSPLCTFRFYVY
jgi:hypothetical protein